MIKYVLLNLKFHRPNINEEAMDMVQDVVLHLNFDDDVIDKMKHVTTYRFQERIDIMSEILVLVPKGL